jgi:hypothetical protein
MTTHTTGIEWTHVPGTSAATRAAHTLTPSEVPTKEPT